MLKNPSAYMYEGFMVIKLDLILDDAVCSSDIQMLNTNVLPIGGGLLRLLNSLVFINISV